MLMFRNHLTYAGLTLNDLSHDFKVIEVGMKSLET